LRAKKKPRRFPVHRGSVRLFKVEETPSTPKLYYNRAVAAVAGLLRHKEKGAERDGREQ
jgi:hypothetical protein